MNKELEDLDYQDCLVSLASIITQHGAQQVVADFRHHYPSSYAELKHCVNQIPARQVAVLFKKPEKP